MANHPAHPDSNVVPFRRHARPANAKRRDLPLGPSFLPTVDRLREIAALSGDSMVTEGPVHPDYLLLELCSEALDLFGQAGEARAIYRRKLDQGATWTDAERAAGDAAVRQERVFIVAAGHLLRRARKLRATTPAGVYAKALIVRSSVTGASGLAQSLADDLIACGGLRQSLTWPDGQTETRP